jgi:hypothetical protein
MILKKNLYLSIGLVLFLYSCKESLPTTYAGCCDIPPFSEKIGTTTMVIPNVFTPDFDGYNDHIIVLANGNVGKISDFIVKDKSNTVVWQSGTKTFNVNENFNWTISEVGNVPEGKLSYTFKVTPPTGSPLQFQGTICKNLSKGVECPSKNTKCSFSTQYSSNGVFDKTIPSGTVCQ